MRQVQHLRDRIAAGEPVFGTFIVEFNAPGAVIAVSHSGFDFVMVDCEHGTYDLSQVRQLIDTAVAAGISPWVRVPAANSSMIGQVLDAGAEGIVVPQVRTMDQVRRVVEQTKYPPLGQRGLHMMRGHANYRVPDDMGSYVCEANRQLITLIQIETAEAAEMVDDIAATDGVDALYIGPGDLSITLGHPGRPDNPDSRRVYANTAAACKKHGKIAGTHYDEPTTIPALVEQGFSVFGWRAAISALFLGLQDVVGRIHSAIGRR